MQNFNQKYSNESVKWELIITNFNGNYSSYCDLMIFKKYVLIVLFQ